MSLEVLIASHNKLISLPEEMGVLDKLMEIVSTNIVICNKKFKEM